MLLSKAHLEFLKDSNTNITCYYERIRSFVFWKNSRIPKSPFEINWPLVNVFPSVVIRIITYLTEYNKWAHSAYVSDWYVLKNVFILSSSLLLLGEVRCFSDKNFDQNSDPKSWKITKPKCEVIRISVGSNYDFLFRIFIWKNLEKSLLIQWKNLLNSKKKLFNKFKEYVGLVHVYQKAGDTKFW